MDGPVLRTGAPISRRFLRGTFKPARLRDPRRAEAGDRRGRWSGRRRRLLDRARVRPRRVGRSAKLIAGFANVGLSLDGGLSVLLAAKAGSTRAARGGAARDGRSTASSLRLGPRQPAREDDELQAAAAKLAARLRRPPRGARASKRLLAQYTDAELSDALDREPPPRASASSPTSSGRRPPRSLERAPRTLADRTV